LRDDIRCEAVAGGSQDVDVELAIEESAVGEVVEVGVGEMVDFGGQEVGCCEEEKGDG
jgi:hypothetical protein